MFTSSERLILILYDIRFSFKGKSSFHFWCEYANGVLRDTVFCSNYVGSWLISYTIVTSYQASLCIFKGLQCCHQCWKRYNSVSSDEKYVWWRKRQKAFEMKENKTWLSNIIFHFQGKQTKEVEKGKLSKDIALNFSLLPFFPSRSSIDEYL